MADKWLNNDHLSMISIHREKVQQDTKCNLQLLF